MNRNSTRFTSATARIADRLAPLMIVAAALGSALVLAPNPVGAPRHAEPVSHNYTKGD